MDVFFSLTKRTWWMLLSGGFTFYFVIGVSNSPRMNLNELKSSPCSALIGCERCGDIEFQNDEFKSDKKSPFCDAIGGCATHCSQWHTRNHCNLQLKIVFPLLENEIFFLDMLPNSFAVWVRIGSGVGRKWMWNFCNLFGFSWCREGWCGRQGSIGWGGGRGDAASVSAVSSLIQT